MDTEADQLAATPDTRLQVEIVPAEVKPQAEESPGFARRAAKRGRRSLRMQYRFLRTMAFSGRLFLRVLFWYVLVQRVMGEEYVNRNGLQRWIGYSREFHAFAVKMGGVMIKLGQFISTRADVLPSEITNELATLRDEVPSVPFEQIRAVVERELGSIPARFSRFDEKPVAAASLGQVHRAQLLNGDRVVVKVLRPQITEICHTDLEALSIVTKVAGRFRFISRRANAPALAEEFGRVLLQELSYRQEAENAARFATMFAKDLGVYIPAVYPEHSTDQVITLEDVTTIKIDDYAGLEKAGISRKAVAKRLMSAYLKQVFEERYFHADPHPGNLFIYPLPVEQTAPSGERPFYLIFVDFGMTGTLSETMVRGLAGTFTALVNRDARKLIESYGQLGFLLPDVDTERLEEAVQTVFDEVWGLTMSQMSSAAGGMVDMGDEFADLLYEMPFQVPQDFIYPGRTMGILSGLCTGLDPTFNPWSELEPYMKKLVAHTISNGANNTRVPVVTSLLKGNGTQALMEIGEIGQTIFRRRESVQETFDQIKSGNIKLRVDPSPSYKRQLTRLERQGQKTTRAVISGSLLIAATMLYTHGDVVPALIGFALAGVGLLGTLLGRDE